MDSNYQDYISENKWQLEQFMNPQNKNLDEFLESHNEHIFGNAKSFGDGFQEINRFTVSDEDEYEKEIDDCEWLFSKSSYKPTEDKVKSWINNLDTHSPKLVIDDIDDGIIPEIIADYDWLEELEIDNQKIKEIKNIPKNLKVLSLFNNYIEIIPKNSLPEGLIELNLSRNKISIVENIPKLLKELDISHNRVKQYMLIDNESLEELNIESNLLESLDNLPKNLKMLDASQNKIKNIDDLIDSIEELDISINNIEKISKLPNNLKRLNAFNNKIKLLQKFPPNLIYVDLSFNELFWIPKLPNTLQKADFSSNKITLLALTNEAGENDYKNGKLPMGNYTISLLNNPLNNVIKDILDDPRVTHNKIENNFSLRLRDIYNLENTGQSVDPMMTSEPSLRNDYMEIKMKKSVVV